MPKIKIPTGEAEITMKYFYKLTGENIASIGKLEQAHKVLFEEFIQEYRKTHPPTQ